MDLPALALTRKRKKSQRTSAFKAQTFVGRSIVLDIEIVHLYTCFVAGFGLAGSVDSRPQSNNQLGDKV
jgi:hypothetical protein